MSDVVVVVVAAGFALMGVGALVRPADVLGQFGVVVATAEGRNEVRAVYGGFGVALAALLILAGIGEGNARDGVLLAAAVALGGMAAGRAVSAVADRPTGLHPVWTYFGLEVASAAALVAVL